MFNLAGEHQAKPCVAVSSEDSVANIRRIESGDSTFGFSQTDGAYGAFPGEGPFAAAGPGPNLRMLIALCQKAFAVVVRADSGIRDFQDLRGKRVGIGKSGGEYTFTCDFALAAYGITVLDPGHVLELGPAEQNQALCSNEVDVRILGSSLFIMGSNGLTPAAACRACRRAGRPWP